MTTKSVATQGTQLYVLDDDGSPTTIITLAQVKGITGVGGSRNIIDITNLDSLVKEKAAGLQDPGNGNFDLVLDPTNAGHQYLEALSTQTTNATKYFYLGLSDGTTAPTIGASNSLTAPTSRTGVSFRGFIKQYQRDFAVDSVAMVKCGVEIVSKPVTTIKS